MDPTTNNKDTSRTKREQKYAPSTHLYYQGRLANFYLNWQGRTNLIVVPHQRVFKLTEFYPLDLGYLYQELYAMMEQKRVRNFTIHTFKHDWDIAPHLFFKIGMGQEQYEQFVKVPYVSAGSAPPRAPPSSPTTTEAATTSTS